METDFHAAFFRSFEMRHLCEFLNVHASIEIQQSLCRNTADSVGQNIYLSRWNNANVRNLIEIPCTYDARCANCHRNWPENIINKNMKSL